MADSPKKDKKGKKDKKDKKDKKKAALGESVEPGVLKSSDEYLDSEKFKPVPNPAFNPALTSSLTSPVSSINSNNSSSSTKNEEKWVISSKRKSDLPVVLTNQLQTPPTENSSPLTPAELQGFAAYKYVPSPGYGHLDPSKHENAHSAFDQLKKVVMDAERQTPNQQPNPTKPTQPLLQAGPAISQYQMPSQMNQRRSPQPMQQQQRPPASNQYSSQNRPVSQQMSPQRHPQQVGKPRPDRLQDGTPVIHYARALWNYAAQIPSELSLNFNDQLAIVGKQPDGWWVGVLLHNKKRGLVPGNYMAAI